MGDLGLQLQVDSHFAFLKAKGYRRIQSTPYHVRFESPKTVVEVVFDGSRSYELGVLISRANAAGEHNPPFTLEEILRLRRAPEAERLSLVQVTTRDAMASFVQQFSELLDRKSTRLNSSHANISYAVFCLKKKK